MNPNEKLELLIKSFDRMFPIHCKIVLFQPMSEAAIGKWVLVEDTPLGYLYERIG